MNLVEKFIETQLADLKDPEFTKAPLFMNGVTVTEQGSDMKLLLCQEPFSKVVALTVYDEGLELYTDRMIFDEVQKQWQILVPIEGKGG